MNDEHEVERIATREEAVATMQAVVDGVGSGTLRFDAGDGESVEVDVPDELEIEVELELEGEDEGDADADVETEVEVEIELEWPVEAEIESEDVPSTEMQQTEENGSESAGEMAGVDEVEEEEAEGEDSVRLEEGESVASDVAPLGPAEPRESLARFEVYRDRADEWRWRLVHRNGNVIADGGEGYSSKQSAQKGLRSVMHNAPGATVVDESDR